MIVQYRVKSRLVDGVREPDLPEHGYNWRVNELNEELDEFIVTEDVDSPDPNLEGFRYDIKVEDLWSNILALENKIKDLSSQMRRLEESLQEIRKITGGEL